MKTMLRTFKRLLIPIAAAACFAGHAHAEALSIAPEAKMNVRVTVSEADAQSFTLQTATYEILDQNDAVVTSSTAATISGAMLIGLADASTWTADSSYTLIFRHTITESPAELYYWRVDIECSDDAIQ